MPLSFDTWFGASERISPQSRAADAWRRINRSPARADDGEIGIVFTKPAVVTKTGKTPAVDLPRQTVRIEPDNRPRVVEGEAGSAPVRHATIFGIRGHATLPDTDVEEGYEFSLAGDHYRCVDVTLVPGEKQADFVVNG